ncbi:MAG: ABC transporter permease [Bacteroidales bacterium]|jgi:ABC-2 type transport system permease protein|nr:ABC transporter permease [Bacteroidales bacterium]
MKKIWLIIQREYLTRVKKKSFIVMTFLGPILMASVWIVPLLLASRSDGIKTIEVLDETGIFFEEFKETSDTKFEYITDDLQTAKENLATSENFAILYIPKSSYSTPLAFYLYSYKNPGLSLKLYLQESANKILENKKLQDVYGIDEETLASVKSNINLVVEDIETNKKSFTEISWALGFIGGMLIYFFIFMYGAQVMRGVIEEKTNRIIEVIVSSVKPIQLMLGKIVGIAMVGLTQFLLWILLTLGIVTAFTAAYSDQIADFKMGEQPVVTDPGQLFQSDAMGMPDTQQGLEALGSDENINQILEVFFSINYGIIILTFLFYFVGGYLLYAALFAAIGSAVDNEADTQQFMMPVTIPLIFSIIIGLSFVLNNPDGSVAYWLSLIPFTSPIIMMIRVPFGINIYTDLIPSMILLIIGFLVTTWIAAKIYRTGILMYGKKVSYRELWKWLTYKP